MELSPLEQKISCLNLWLIVSTGSPKHSLKPQETPLLQVKSSQFFSATAYYPTPGPLETESHGEGLKRRPTGGTERLSDELSVLQPGSCKALATIKPKEISVPGKLQKASGKEECREAVKMWELFFMRGSPPRPCQPMAKCPSLYSYHPLQFVATEIFFF